MVGRLRQGYVKKKTGPSGCIYGDRMLSCNPLYVPMSF